MKLSAPVPFRLVKQVRLPSISAESSPLTFRQAKIEDGPYAGHVAILFKPSMPFEIMKLPLNVRTQIFSEVVHEPSNELTMTLTQSSKKTAYCPEYRAKNKLALMLACKQLRDETAPIVYGHNFHFPGTQVITHFLLQIGQFRKYLVSLHSDTYNPVSARTMFHLLPEARGLERLSFSHMSSNQKPKTAINDLFGDAYPWLQVVGGGNPVRALKILKFSAAAYHRREKDEEGNVEVVQWDHGEQLLFWRGLKARLESLPHANPIPKAASPSKAASPNEAASFSEASPGKTTNSNEE